MPMNITLISKTILNSKRIPERKPMTHLLIFLKMLTVRRYRIFQILTFTTGLQGLTI